ncbi:MAG: acetate/propionate family kinase, partial [bacterium]|nr:acetate/propionate family kinase [bacterium]
IVNTGSASKKFALYEAGRESWRIHIEKENGGFVCTVVELEKIEKTKISKEDFDQSAHFLRERLVGIPMAGVRVVAPGKYFLENRKIDNGFLKKLEAAKEQAPLHVAPALAVIGQLRKVAPKMKLFAISDSAFYADMPANAKLYSLPSKVAEKFGIYRYGYHGISVSSIVVKIKKILGSVPMRTVVCHLGSGSSVLAVKGGKAFDASMGFTPLEGLPMGTRIGNIDAGAVIYLAKKLKKSPDELGEFFNRECGLLGLSGKTNDVRELLELEKKGDAKAAQALESFVYGVKKLIGAYAAAMGGLDLLVFTATIGERSFMMRRRICAGMESLGILLDANKNDATVSRDGFINTSHSRVKIAVIPTDEFSEIYRQTKTFNKRN